MALLIVQLEDSDSELKIPRLTHSCTFSGKKAPNKMTLKRKTRSIS